MIYTINPFCTRPKFNTVKCISQKIYIFVFQGAERLMFIQFISRTMYIHFVLTLSRLCRYYT